MGDPRQALDQLIQQKGSSYAAISRMIGRNASYIQQFIRRGSPRQLEEQDRTMLAQFFGVDEKVLGAPIRNSVVEFVQVPMLNVEASAGHGAIGGLEAKWAQFGFDETWLRRLSISKATSLSIIRVQGDSMEETLHDGDEVMVDLGDGQSRLRDGIYVLRMDGALNVKRVAIEPQGRRVSVLSDNPAYPSWRGLERRTIDIVGRVRWFGRALQ
jgi:phage repressor protein C with HTH and peptisase S24 domain